LPVLALRTKSPVRLPPRRSRCASPLQSWLRVTEAVALAVAVRATGVWPGESGALAVAGAGAETIVATATSPARKRRAVRTADNNMPSAARYRLAVPFGWPGSLI
jgi:hypothetical protein